MRNALVVFAIVLAGFAAFTAFGKDDGGVKDVDIPAAQGPALKASMHEPAAANGACVVLAPGQAYSRDQPLMKRSAEALAGAGFLAIRFDWAYFTAGKQPSADCSGELADVDAAITFAKKQEGVTKVLLAGKSLGSLIALKWSNTHEEELAGLALLTFPATDPDKPGQFRDGAADLKKTDMAPLILCGDHDPMAELNSLYKLASFVAHPPIVVIVPGDHSLGTGAKNDPFLTENVEMAVRHLVVWAKRRIGK